MILSYSLSLSEKKVSPLACSLVVWTSIPGSACDGELATSKVIVLNCEEPFRVGTYRVDDLDLENKPRCRTYQYLGKRMITAYGERGGSLLPELRPGQGQQ